MKNLAKAGFKQFKSVFPDLAPKIKDLIQQKTPAVMNWYGQGKFDHRLLVFELEGFPFQSGPHSLHLSRIRWVKSLPPADHIVDLGGASAGDPRATLVLMGYPYPFKTLAIYDLPPEDAHPIFQKDRKLFLEEYDHKGGKIRHIYSSISDLSALKDGSVDLVNSGQSFEHITQEQGHHMLRECLRILRPGGWLCLDTPNAKLTRIQSPSEMIHPDHKIEYYHPELEKMFTEHGFQIVEAKGLNWMPETVNRNEFLGDELNRNSGIFADLENCYILAYRLQKPTQS